MCHSHCRYFVILRAHAKQINYKNVIFKMSSANIMTTKSMTTIATTIVAKPAIIQYVDDDDDDEFVHCVNGRSRQTSKRTRLK